MSAVRRIVVVNFTRMGDIIQSGPLLRSLERRYPGCRITMLVFDRFAGVAARLPMVSEVLPLDVDTLAVQLDARRGNLPAAYRQLSELLADQRLLGADLVVNLSHTPLSATLCGLLSTQTTWGLHRQADSQMRNCGEWFHYLFSVIQDRTLNPFNLVEIYLRMNAVRDGEYRLEMSVSDEDDRDAVALLQSAGVSAERPYVVLQAGASSPSRQWPAASFASLAVELANRGLQSVLVGASDERALGEEIVHRSGGIAVSLVGQTQIGGLAAVVRRAQRLVSNDTGTIHVATAVGTPSLGIYLGPASAKDTAPWGSGHIVIEPDLACSPCGYRDVCASFACHRQVDVGHVLNVLLAAPGELASRARLLSGIRIFETRLTPTGEYSLRRMNASHTERSMIPLYRKFWSALLDGTDVPSAPLDPNLTARFTPGIQRLREILTGAEVALRSVETATPDASLEDRLARQVVWQEELRTVMTEHADLAPFCRFLLVRLSTVRTNELHAYLADLRGTVDFLRRGVTLFDAMLENTVKSTRQGHVHAA